MPDFPLKIGYIWQYESSGLSPVSATALHMRSVTRAFERCGHSVRMVAVRNGRPHWSDDLQSWQPVELPRHWAFSRPYRLFERAVRGVQGRLRLPFVRWFESYRFSLACEAALSGCDVLYERFWLMAYGGLLAARRMSAPLFYEVNGDIVEEYAQLGIHLSKAQWAAIHFVTRRMFARSARVIAVSQPLRLRIIDRWNVDPACVEAVSNGADVDLFSRRQDGDAVRQRYGVGDAPVVVFVGNFQPWHGLDLLIDGFARLGPAHTAVRLVLVGDGPVRPALQAQAGRLGLGARVIFTGAVSHEDVAALLEAAQVAVVNPRLTPVSLSQSPLKLFEYMAAGKAIVAPAMPNVQRVLEDRLDGLLVTPDNAASLAAALEELLSDESLRRSLGEAASRKALERYSWDATVKELEAIFRQELAH